MHRERINKFRELIREKGLDFVMITSEPNMFYFSGYSAISLERLVALLIRVDEDQVFLIVPKLEETRAQEKCRLKDFELISYSDQENPVEILEKIIYRGGDQASVGVEEMTPLRHIYPLVNRHPGTRLSMIDETIYSLREIKESVEIETLKRAAEINCRVLSEAIRNVKEGVSEKSLVMHVKNYACEEGADEVSFALIQSGRNSAMPHQESTGKIIQRGDIVVLDVGIRYQGYFSDLTRTVVCGSPSNIQVEIFNIVLRAQEAALGIIREGIRAEEVDRAARGTIESSGYGEFFIHRTGHGIGLEVHEPPYIKAGNLSLLKSGMVFTVEPGVYLPNQFGVRIEDNVVVTKDGHINLARLPKSLYVKDYE